MLLRSSCACISSHFLLSKEIFSSHFFYKRITPDNAFNLHDFLILSKSMLLTALWIIAFVIRCNKMIKHCWYKELYKIPSIYENQFHTMRSIYKQHSVGIYPGGRTPDVRLNTFVYIKNIATMIINTVYQLRSVAIAILDLRTDISVA